jgi:hypothetical protein
MTLNKASKTRIQKQQFNNLNLMKLVVRNTCNGNRYKFILVNKLLRDVKRWHSCMVILA